VESYSIERFGDLRTLAAAARSAQQLCRTRPSCAGSRFERREVVVSIKCGESDTTTGLGSCPAVAEVVVDRLVADGGTVPLRRDVRADGRRAAHRGALRLRRRQGAIPGDVRRLHPGDRGGPARTCSGRSRRRATSAAACRPSRRRRSATSPRRAQRRWWTRSAPGEAPRRPGLSFMDSSSAARGVHHPDGCGGCGGPPVPDGAGQHHRQPAGAGDQGDGQPADRADDVGARGPSTSRACCGASTRCRRRGDGLLALVDRVVNGRLTCAEALGHREFVLTKLYRSA